MRTNRIKTVVGANSRRAKNRPQSLQMLERDLHMLSQLDQRDHEFAGKLGGLLERAGAANTVITPIEGERTTAMNGPSSQAHGIIALWTNRTKRMGSGQQTRVR